MRRIVAAALLAASAAGFHLGCSLAKSFEGYSDCQRRRWPDRATGADSKGPDLTGAMQQIVLEPESVGYDLDGLCTGLLDTPGACVSKKGPSFPPDSPIANGVDNAAGRLFIDPKSIDRTVNDDLAHALYGGVFRITEYNGTPNDPLVKVAFIPIAGVNGVSDGTATAKFDGTDTFLGDRAYFENDELTSPTTLSSDAYVRDGVLVAPFGTFEIRFRSLPKTTDGRTLPPARYPLKNVVLVGKLEIVKDMFRIRNGQLAGRIAVGDIIKTFSNAGVCPGQPGNFDLAKAAACDNTDLPIAPQDDGRGAPCDALSFALGMVVGPAKARGRAESLFKQTPDPCAPDGGAPPAIDTACK